MISNKPTTKFYSRLHVHEESFWESLPERRLGRRLEDPASDIAELWVGVTQGVEAQTEGAGSEHVSGIPGRRLLRLQVKRAASGLNLQES